MHNFILSLILKVEEENEFKNEEESNEFLRTAEPEGLLNQKNIEGNNLEKNIAYNTIRIKESNLNENWLFGDKRLCEENKTFETNKEIDENKKEQNISNESDLTDSLNKQEINNKDEQIPNVKENEINNMMVNSGESIHSCKIDPIISDPFVMRSSQSTEINNPLLTPGCYYPTIDSQTRTLTSSSCHSERSLIQLNCAVCYECEQPSSEVNRSESDYIINTFLSSEIDTKDDFDVFKKSKAASVSGKHRSNSLPPLPLPLSVLPPTPSQPIPLFQSSNIKLSENNNDPLIVENEESQSNSTKSSKYISTCQIEIKNPVKHIVSPFMTKAQTFKFVKLNNNINIDNQINPKLNNNDQNKIEKDILCNKINDINNNIDINDKNIIKIGEELELKIDNFELEKQQNNNNDLSNKINNTTKNVSDSMTNELIENNTNYLIEDTNKKDISEYDCDQIDLSEISCLDSNKQQQLHSQTTNLNKYKNNDILTNIKKENEIIISNDEIEEKCYENDYKFVDELNNLINDILNKVEYNLNLEEEKRRRKEEEVEQNKKENNIFIYNNQINNEKDTQIRLEENLFEKKEANKTKQNKTLPIKRKELNESDSNRSKSTSPKPDINIGNYCYFLLPKKMKL